MADPFLCLGLTLGNMRAEFSDRNLQLQSASLAERSNQLLSGHPISNWSDNLRQLHADMLARVAELETELVERCPVTCQSK